MDSNVDDKTLLWELARNMASQDRCLAAAALRKLVPAGYATLAEVDAASDWVLLATPGIGPGRLGVLRRLIQPDWQPPSHKAIKAAQRFLSTARLALRFWPVETVEEVIKGSVPELYTGCSVERRLSLELFAEASQRALRHGEKEEWLETLSQLRRSPERGILHRLASPSSDNSGIEASMKNRCATTTTDQELHPEQDKVQDSEHYAYSPEKRRQIVEHYRTARKNGEIENKDTWADTNYGISRKTLWRYEQEFPEANDE